MSAMIEKDPPPYKYWAFISYSHRDKLWGDWLHKRLETYRVPKTLVGKATFRDENVPKRAQPIFRDREELPTAVDLGAVINLALQQSRYLIVICSPNSAKSEWVNQEIIHYKRMGRENRVLAIIVDGEPNAVDGKLGFSVDDECFPRALKFKIGLDGNLSDERTEPIAADARSHADGKSNALLKLLAGILGVNYDDLKQREIARQRRRRQLMVLATVCTLSIAWYIQTRFANERNERQYQIAVVALGQARQLLVDSQPDLAAITALNALESAENTRRKLEPAWWIMRRALDANRIDNRWRADSDSIDTTQFDHSGSRLLTFSRATGVANLWSIPDGKRIASLGTDQRTGLATFSSNNSEVITVQSWEKIAKTYSDSSSCGVDLNWWDSASGKKLRSLTIPNTRFLDLSLDTVSSPIWIIGDAYSGDESLYRLIRLSDGWTNQTLPKPEKQFQGTGPELIPDCGVVLLVDPPQSVRLFTLGGDGAERGVLEGISPMEKLRLTHFIPSLDKTAFAALVWNGDTLLSIGVWRASDGKLIVSHQVEDDDSGSHTWLREVGVNGLTGNSEKLIAMVANDLGRIAQPRSSYDAAGIAWHDADSPVAAILGKYNVAQLFRPKESWHMTLSNEAESLALSPDGKLIAMGDQRGIISLIRTECPYQVEAEIPLARSLINEIPLNASDPTPSVLVISGTDQVTKYDISNQCAMAEFKGLVEPPKTNLRFSVNPNANWLMVNPSFPMMREIPQGWETSFYDWTSGQLLGRVPAREYQLARTGRQALAQDAEGLHIIGLKENALTKVKLLSTHTQKSEWSSATTFFPDGVQVIEARGDGTIEIFASATGKSIHTFSFAEDLQTSINSISISPSGRWCLLATYNQWWRVDLENSTAEKVFSHDEKPDNNLQFLDNEKLLVGNSGSMMKWWSFPDLQLIGQIKSDGFSTTAKILPDSNNIVLTSRWDKVVTIVDKKTSAVQSRLNDAIAIDDALTMVAVNTSMDDTKILRVVRLRDGEILTEQPGISVTDAFFAADGSRLAFILENRLVSMEIAFDAADLRQRAKSLRQRLTVNAK